MGSMEMAIHSSILAWKSLGQRILAGYSPWGRKELDMTERLHFTNKAQETKKKKVRPCSSVTTTL